jgi:hypothetical protein
MIAKSSAKIIQWVTKNSFNRGLQRYELAAAGAVFYRLAPLGAWSRRDCLPLSLAQKQRPEQPAMRLAGSWERAERRAKEPHVGARAGRRQGGPQVPEKKKKNTEVFLLISRQPHRGSGRARDFQRARRPGLSG